MKAVRDDRSHPDSRLFDVKDPPPESPSAKNFHLLRHSDLYQRAERPLSSVPRAFLRWAGSKRSILSRIVEILPPHFRTYREPFLGSGSLFFLLQPTNAVLSDTCVELMAALNAIRDNVSAVMRYLNGLDPRDKQRFDQIRSFRSSGRFRNAAEFIYLNRACWNGLYRVNSGGIFNVPYGRPKSGVVVDFENLKACSLSLSQPGVSLRTCDFEAALTDARDGDLVYLDPPYVTAHANNGFVEYNEVLFSWEDQVRLAEVARTLMLKGAHVIVSSANHAEIFRLYPDFRLRIFERPSTLASDVARRRIVSEALLTSI